MKLAPAGEFFSARMVPLVFLDDFGGDGEAEAGAALLGGEVRQEEALAHLVGEAGAGVGDGELDHAAGEQRGGDAEFAQQSSAAWLRRRCR